MFLILQRKIFWEIEYLNGLIVTESETALNGSDWYDATKNYKDIKYLSLLTPVGKYQINIQTGEILNQSISAEFKGQRIELTNRNITYFPIQRKRSEFIGTQYNQCFFHEIGWEADFKDFKVRVILSINTQTYQPNIFFEEVN